MDSTPYEFLCPITRQIMSDPVVAEDGRSYERTAIETWLKTHRTSPLTNQTISNNLISNLALRDAIESYVNPNTGSVGVQFNTDLSLHVNSIRLDEKTFLLNTTVKAYTDDTRKPSVFICIIDVSGSMGIEASIATNGTENDGFTRLDLVKHSVKTIINVLNVHDMLAIVAFTETASIALPLTPMNNQGKQMAEEALGNLEPLNSTNIWDGLRVALEISSGATCKNKNVASLLLTDGASNFDPPRGIIPTFKNYISEHKLNGVIHTFGFGYDIDFKLLKEIAEAGSGLFGFIPDCSMVGTIFVNTMSIILTSVVNDCKLSIKGNGASLDVVDYTFGPICVGQNRHLIQRIVLDGDPKIELSIHFNGKSITAAIESIDTSSEGNEIFLQYARMLLIEGIKFAIQERKFESKQDHIENAITKIKALPAKDDPVVIAYLKDLEDQITQAVSRQDWFEKWGNAYLISLARAHELEVCHNFKDPGVQLYGGALFRDIQNIADKVFCDLPAPKASAKSSYSCGSAPVNMSAYYNSSGVCFDGNGSVKLSNENQKKVKDLQKGDVLMNGAVVLCVVVTKVSKPVDVVQLNGVFLTPWHPVLLDDGWKFPISLKTREMKQIGYWYNIVLNCQHWIEISGLKCLTLGHGNFTDPIIGHSYYSGKIVDDLRKMKGWSLGKVNIAEEVERDPITGSVVAIRSNCGTTRVL